MSSRPGWTAMLLGLCACGELPEPPWLLTEEPRVLAVRVQVVEPGPLSYDFLPIPADRVRSQPLPGDTVDVSAWVVAGDREVPMHELDPAWFVCPRSARCVSALGRPGAAEPCVGVLLEETACRLPEGEAPRFVAPDLDRQVPLQEQTKFRVAMVGHVDGRMTTAECIGLVSDPSVEDWSGCLVAYRHIDFGPARRLVTHAIGLGIEVAEPPEDFLEEPVRPPFNPEIVPLELFPVSGNRRLDLSRPVAPKPGETTVLESGAVYSLQGSLDPKDVQEVQVVQVASETESSVLLSSYSSAPSAALFSSVPEVLEFSRLDGWQIWLPEDPGPFEVRFVVNDLAGGTAWATFHFEVAAP